jgi:predicted polyphosphate/ATP-dependent NAD kinase
MQEMGLPNTLLGVDLVKDQQLIASDLTAPQLQQYIGTARIKLVITPIGGQGHILGRGNQQLSPMFIKALGRENIMLVASKAKLLALTGRPLIADSGDMVLDSELAGPIPVITGYHDQVLYPIGGSEYAG